MGASPTFIAYRARDADMHVQGCLGLSGKFQGREGMNRDGFGFYSYGSSNLEDVSR